MLLDDKDLKIERITGSGPGGQHRNKTASCVRITHIPTGIQVTIDGRYQHKNLKLAKKELGLRLAKLKQNKIAQSKKDRRDIAIKDHTIVRDYDFKKDRVYDRRSKKSASIKDVLRKGNIDLIKPRPNDFDL